MLSQVLQREVKADQRFMPRPLCLKFRGLQKRIVRNNALQQFAGIIEES
jgi:hypothetical protein